MAATVHVIARFVAKAGKEAELTSVLNALIAPTRRELGCYQHDLLIGAGEPRDFCVVERWGSDKSLDEHLATPHLKGALTQIEPLVETPPDIRRYYIL